MSNVVIMVLKRQDERLRVDKYTHIIDPKAVASVEEWLARNLKRMPAPHELGVVMPERELIIARDGNLESPATRTIEIYGAVDSTGRRAISRREVAMLDGIFDKWGKPGVPSMKS